MGGMRAVERGLEFREWQARHHHVESTASEHAIPPQKWEKILTDHEVCRLGGKRPRISPREQFIKPQQCALPRRSLRREPAGNERAVEYFQRRLSHAGKS